MRAGSRKLAFAFVAIGLISDRVVMTIVVRLVKYDPQGDIRAQAHAVHVPSSVGISGTLKTRFRQTLQVVGLECRRKYRCRHVFFYHVLAIRMPTPTNIAGYLVTLVGVHPQLLIPRIPRK